MIECITPTTAAVTLAEMKEHCRVVGTLDDTYLTDLILAAQRLVESETRRTLSSAVWQETTDVREVPIEYGDLVSVDHVKTVAKDGTETTVDAADWNLPTNMGARYVYIDDSVDGISFRIRYTTTINEEALPMAKHAVMMIGAHWFEHREEVVVGVTPAKMPLGYQHIRAHLAIRRF